MLLSETLTEQVIGLAIEVHRHIGPGLLESVYEQCLCVELRRAGVVFAGRVPMPMLYKGEPVGAGFKADLVVAEPGDTGNQVGRDNSQRTRTAVADLSAHERPSRRAAAELQRAPADGWPPPLRRVEGG